VCDSFATGDQQALDILSLCNQLSLRLLIRPARQHVTDSLSSIPAADRPADHPLFLRLLGGASIERGGELISGKGVQRRRLAILILLAAAPRRMLDREQVLGLLWPDEAPETGRRALNEALYVIRRELGTDVVRSIGSETLQLDERVRCDLTEMLDAIREDDIERAIARYAGPFLGSWFVRGANDFEQWADLQRTRIAAQFTDALARAATVAETAGRDDRALRFHQRLLELDPTSSGYVEKVVLGLAREGETAAALASISRHRSLLKDEFDADIPAALATLEAQIRAGWRPVSDTKARVVGSAADHDPKAETAGNKHERLHSPTGDAHVDAPVRSNASEPADPANLNTAVDGTLAASIVDQSNGNAARSKLSAFMLPRRETLALFAVAICIVAGVFALRKPGAVFALRAPTQHSVVAVLPFTIDSDSAALDYVATGIAEELARDFGRLKPIQVVLPTVAASMLNDGTRGGATDFDVVISGAVTRSDRNLRVTARVVDRNGTQLGTAYATAPFGDQSSLVDQLITQLAQPLSGVIGQSRYLETLRGARDRYDASDVAIEHVWRAQALVRTTTRARTSSQSRAPVIESERAQRADSLLAQAELDAPGWPTPTLERARLSLVSAGFVTDDARLTRLQVGMSHTDRLLAALTRTNAASPAQDVIALAEAHWVRGQIEMEMATARASYRPESTLLRASKRDLIAAIRTDSTRAGVWASLAKLHWILGENAAAMDASTRALSLDPYMEDADLVIDGAWRFLTSLADRRGAETWCARGREMFPSDWRFVECELTLMYIDAAGAGKALDPARAWRLVDSLTRLQPDTVAARVGYPYSPAFRRMVAAIVSAAAGDSAHAIREYAAIRRALAPSQELSTDLLFDAAHLAFALGDSIEGESRLAAYIAARPDLRELIQNDKVTQLFRRRGGRTAAK
jgi:DNA-binding SARP family transcriptional activator/tetratricopeptide (TPR) repeat protein